MSEKFYESQRRNRDLDATDPGRVAHSESWLRSDTVDAWRHERMYRFLDPFVHDDPSASWLTVGDGRLGSDAAYLLRSVTRVVATDISATAMARAAALGRVGEWSAENAERLSFADEQYDYVLCKESYHHFPRPMVALHEMIRVSRRAVILIEPYDDLTDSEGHGIGEVVRLVAHAAARRLGILRHVRALLPPGNAIFRRATFEESGNYVYKISKAELSKVALGMGLHSVAFAGFNDAYEKGIEFERAVPESPQFNRLKSRIDRMDRTGCSGLLAAVIFKSAPTTSLSSSLSRSGYTAYAVPANPHAPAEGR